RELVEIHPEDLRQLARDLAAASTAAAATPALHGDLRLVFLLRPLQVLQRAILRRQGAVGADRRKLALGHLHLGNRLGQELGDPLERRLRFQDPARHARDQTFDLLAQPRLRKTDDDRLLLQLVGRVVLAIALAVERRGDDLALLVGERIPLVHLAATTAATT